MLESHNDRYSLGIRSLHWLMSVCIFGLVALGIYMTPFDSRPAEASDRLYYWHKSFGILVLTLLVIRIIVRWRQRNRLPSMPGGLSRVEKMLAKNVKIFLYALMFCVPMSGWLHSSVYPFSSGVHFFFITLPDIAPKSATIAPITVKVHCVLAYSLLAFVLLHVVGALKHRFVDRQNDVLHRML